MMGYELQVRQQTEGDLLVVCLKGDISIQAEEQLLGLHPWEEGLVAPAKYLLLDLTEVQYINSLGIAILIRIVRSLARVGCPSFACGVTPHYEKLFRMVGLTQYMMIYPDRYAVRQRLEQLP